MAPHLGATSPEKKYAVFVSYRHADKNAVHAIALRLAEQAGLEPFVDTWNLVRGNDFTPELAEAVKASRCVAAFKGPEGMGEWVERETELAFVNHIRVIPVLLPGATEELPSFLPLATWVDFRKSLNDPEPFRELVAGIRGEAPGRPKSLKDSRHYQSVVLTFVARDDAYWAEVRGSDIPGHDPVRIQLDPAAMRQRFELAMRPTRTVQRKGSPTKVPDGAALTGVGTELYQALAGSDLGASLEGALRSVDCQHGLGVRLLVETSNAPALAGLPWEFLSQPESGLSLASSPFTPVTRWFDLAGGLESLLLTRPLRLLVVSATPTDRPPVSLVRELAQLKSQLSEATLFETLEHATPESLKDALHRHRPNVLHFVGHGEMRDGRGAIVLEAEGGVSNPVTGRKLAVLLENDVPPLQLVFLNSCEGGAVAPGDPFGGVADALVRRHMPAVIAMQFPIPDDAAVALARGFYRDVTAGTPVDAALSSARGVLYADDARFEGFEWGTPALYVRTPKASLLGTGAGVGSVATAVPIAAAALAPVGTGAAAVVGALPPVVTPPPAGLMIGGGFFADRWVAIVGILALTVTAITGMFVFRLQGPPHSIATTSGETQLPSTAPSSGGTVATVTPAASPTSAGPVMVPPPVPPHPLPGRTGAEGGVPPAGSVPAPPPFPPPPPLPPLPPKAPSALPSPSAPRPIGPSASEPPDEPAYELIVEYAPPSRLVIDAIAGVERRDTSDVSGAVAAEFRFRVRDRLRPFVRAGAGAAARDEEPAWMSLDAGVDVQVGSGFLGGGGGVRTTFSDARGTVLVRGGLDLSAIDRRPQPVQFVVEGRWIQGRSGAAASDYSVLTGVRIPIGAGPTRYLDPPRRVRPY